MFIGGDSLLGGVFRLRVLMAAVFAAALLVCVSLVVPLVFAQDPEDETSEPGYTILPGEEGYVEVPEPSPDGVEGEAEHECDDDPQAAECPPSPPTGLSLSRLRASLYLTYSLSGWRGSNTHWYRFELQRSGTRSGTYTFYSNVWGRRSPALVGNVGNAGRGKWYKLRAQRCRTFSTSDCGDWTSFTAPLEVPNLPRVATGLASKLSDRTLTGTYMPSVSSSSKDRITIARRLIRSTGLGSSEVRNISGSGYGWSVLEGYEYRFRVRRCLDDARSECSAWSGWSRWKPVPALASRLSVSLTDGTVSAIYSASGASTEDQIKVESRVGGSTTTGDPENITGSGHSWGGLSGTAYRFQVRRCLDTGRKECGRWSAWSPWKSVPVTATNPSLSLSDGTLTATYSPTSRSKDVIETENRSSGSSRSGAKSQANAEGSGHRLTGLGGRDHRFRVKRCSADNRDVRYDCGNWSEWSPWKSVPATASNPSLSLSDGTLTATYSPTSRSKDVIETENRSSGSSRSGAKSQANSEGSGHRLTGSGGREYRFRVKRCSADDRNVRYDCGYWSAWSSWKSVPVTATNPSLSLDYGELTARYSPTGESDDVIEVENRSIGSSSSGSKSQANSDGSGHDWDASGGREYRFRVKRCSADNRNVRYDCGHWSVFSSWQEVPASPTGLSQSRSGATLTFTYSGGSYNVIDVDRRLIGEDEVDDYRTLNRDSGYSRTVDRGYEYQFRASRCTSRSRSVCGPWSSPTDWLRFPRLPDPPTDLVLKRSKDDLTLTYDRSSWSDGTGHYYEFVLRQSDTERGSFDEEDTKDDTRSPLSFRNVDRGYWYQVFGRRCTDSGRKDCPDWPTTGSNKVKVPVLPGKPAKPTLTVSEDDLTVGYTAVTGTYPKFNFASNETKSGRYDAYAGGTLVGAKLSSVATGKWYKVTLQLCTDDGLTDCSVESDESAAAGVPHGKPGTPSLTVSEDDLTVVYTVVAGAHDQFDFESSPSSGGTYKDYTEGTLSGTKRSDVARGAWYKVRVRRCLDSQHTVCSEWSEYSGAVVVLPNRPGKPTLTVSEDDLTVGYTVDDGFTSKDDYEFTTNDAESGNYTAYTGGTLSGAKLEGVATGMWYKVRVRRCLETTHVNCSAWSVYSDAKEVPEVSRFPALAKPTIASRADGTSVAVGFTLPTGFDYQLQLQSRLSPKDEYATDGSAKPVAGSTSHAFTGIPASSGRTYRVQLRACVSGSTTDCGLWVASDTTMVSKAPAPTATGMTLANEDDLTITYTVPSWSHGTATVYEFKIRRADSSSGSFTSDYTDATTPSGQPHKFNNVHTGYYYKALSRRCSDTAKSICGDWSGVQSGVNVPALSAVPAPTNIRVTAGEVNVKASFVASSWPGQIFHRYVFELGKSSTKTGTFVYGRSTNDYSNDEVRFDGVEAGKWYKVRAKRCYADRKRCSAWAESADAEQTEMPSPKIDITKPEGSRKSEEPGLAIDFEVSVTGLDPTESYTVRITSSSNPRSSASAVLKTSRCDAATTGDYADFPVVGAKATVSLTFYGCVFHAYDDVIATLIDSGEVVLRDTFRVFLKHEISKPESLRADGNSRGTGGRPKFEVTWKEDDAEEATWDLRYAEECPAKGRLCDEEAATWKNPIKGIKTRPHTVNLPRVIPLSATLPPQFNKLYQVQVRVNRGGLLSDWSKPVYVHPSTVPTTNSVATMRMYGHQADGVYNYRFCDDALPEFKKVGKENAPPELIKLTDSDRSTWVEEIQAGFATWSPIVNWSEELHDEERTFVGTARETTHMVNGRDECGPYDLLSFEIFNLDLFGLKLHPEGTLNHPFPEVRFVERLVLVARCRANDPWVTACAPLSSRAASVRLFLDLLNTPIPYDADVLFDKTAIWEGFGTTSANGCHKLRRTATHEVGHSLGVWGKHAELSASIMHERGSNDRCDPHGYDIAAILSNYQIFR